MGPLFFATPAEWRRWLARHHARVDQLWVGFHRKASGRPSITWPESVDEALCFGWIDGLRKTLNAGSYAIRLTPRRAGSIWSVINTQRAAELLKLKRMRPAGLKAYRARTSGRSGVYSFEQRREAKLTRAQQRALRANAGAWRFFAAQAPWYRRTATWWVTSAKWEETKQRRLAMLIADSAQGRRVGPLRRKESPRAGARGGRTEGR